MPTVISTVSFTTDFTLNASPVGKFSFVDTSDYSTPSIPLTGVKGVFTITAPGGTTIYENTNFGAADIVRNVSPDNGILIQLPLDAAGNVVRGSYIITYSVQITDGTNPPYIVTQTNTYDYEYVSPVVCITQKVDCISPLFTSSDITNYQINGITPTITRTHTVSFPAVVSPITGSTAIITTGTFYEGETASVVSSVLSYAFSNFTVSDTVTGNKFTSVSCEWNCKVTCCINEFNKRLDYALRTDINLYQRMSNVAGVIAFKYADLMTSISCGQPQQVSRLIEEIKQLADCKEDCGCNDGTPKLVVGLGGGSGINTVIVSGNAAITVTESVVGNTNTWTITFSQTLVDKINNAYNTVVNATDSSVTVTDSGIINGVRTFGVKANSKYLLVHSDTVGSSGTPPATLNYTLLAAVANTMAVGDKLVMEMLVEPNGGGTAIIGTGAGISINSQPTTTT